MTEIGGMTVAEMRQRMSAAEWIRWKAFFSLRAERIKADQPKPPGSVKKFRH